jgi:hypothetical protein
MTDWFPSTTVPINQALVVIKGPRFEVLANTNEVPPFLERPMNWAMEHSLNQAIKVLSLTKYNLMDEKALEDAFSTFQDSEFVSVKLPGMKSSIMGKISDIKKLVREIALGNMPRVSEVAKDEKTRKHAPLMAKVSNIQEQLLALHNRLYAGVSSMINKKNLFIINSYNRIARTYPLEEFEDPKKLKSFRQESLFQMDELDPKKIFRIDTSVVH